MLHAPPHCILPRPEHDFFVMGNALLHLLHFTEQDRTVAAAAVGGFQRFRSTEDQDTCVGQGVFDLADVIAPCPLGRGNIEIAGKSFIGTVGKDD